MQVVSVVYTRKFAAIMVTIPQHLVSKYLKYRDLVPAVENALVEYSSKKSVQPLRSSASVPKHNGTILAMPSYSISNDVLATKIVTIYPDNASRNKPSHHTYVLLMNPKDGSLVSFMDGEAITAKRTAAASVVATQLLVSGTPKILGVLGAGVQAKSHILALSEFYDFTHIKVWDRNYQKTKMFCAEMKELNLSCHENGKECVAGADIVVTATLSKVPVLEGKWLKPGCHVNCVGACRPTWRELDDECMSMAMVYVDSRESAENESGDIIMSKAEVYAEIGEVILREKELKRGKITLFKSLGLGIEDAVAADLVWKNYIQDHAM